MAHRAYLYSLSNRPDSYADRPDTISGLSEWPNVVPFSYRILVSGDPQLCASLVSDGLYAISGDFETGFARLQTFLEIVRTIASGRSPDLIVEADNTLEFLEGHRDRYLLLETVELHPVSERSEEALRASVETEIDACRKVGSSIAALPRTSAAAGMMLQLMAVRYGLALDDGFDGVRDQKTVYPMGLSFWDEVLYFAPQNRADFEASA